MQNTFVGIGSIVTIWDKDLEEKMISVMGTKVNVNQKGKGKGKIEIEYYSEAELERIFDLLMSLPQN